MRRLLLFLTCLILTISLFSQQNKIALVIGNSNYQNGAPLANPVNDAEDIGEKLKIAGFDVSHHTDLSQTAMKKVIDEFGVKLEKADIGLFFYAGHGIQAKGSNYLIPVDAALKTENDVEYNCVDAGRILGKMEDAGTRSNIIILDACRDNPFERSWSRKSRGAGLAFTNAPNGTFIAYSTAPGKTASDGYYRNSPFTAGMLEYIDTPNLKIEDLFKLVRTSVRLKSNGEQVPWTASSLEGDFYFSYDKDEKPYDLSAANKQASTESSSNDKMRPGPDQSIQDYEASRKTLAKGIRSIAVMPFTDYTGDENNIYLASGMHDALIGELGRLGQVRVISKNSTLSYSDLQKTISEIASELKVDGVVETSIVGIDDKIRIQLKLYSVNPVEELLWSQVFDSDKGDVFGLYDRVIKNIADEIQLTLSSEQKYELTHSKKINPDAYEAYVIGRHYWKMFTPQELEISLQYFEKALLLDENFALAYLGISDAWFGLLQLGIIPQGENDPIGKHRTALTKALQLDNSVADIHYSLGNMYGSFNWDWNECEKEYIKALEINPNFSDVYAGLSNLYASLGRTEESIEKGKLALNLDPHNIFNEVIYAATFMFARKYDDAIATANDVLKKDPNNFLVKNILPLVFHMKGNFVEGLNSWKSFGTTFYTSEYIQYDQIFKYDNTEDGYYRILNNLADTLVLHQETTQFDVFNIALMYACAGNKERTIDMLNISYDMHNPNMAFLANPCFDIVREDPRFQDICKKMNLPCALFLR